MVFGLFLYSLRARPRSQLFYLLDIDRGFSGESNNQQEAPLASEFTYTITKEVYDDTPPIEGNFDMTLDKLSSQMPVLILNPTPPVNFDTDSH